jgi:hypothetical protein
VPSSIEHLVDTHSFRVAFLIAGVATLVMLGIAGIAAWRRDSEPLPMPVLGLVGAVAAVFGLRSTDYWTGDLLLGLVALGAGGAAITVLGRYFEAPLLAGAVLAVPGALLTAAAVDANPLDWVQPFVVVAIVVAAATVADFDNYQSRTGFGPVFLAVTALGVYWTVPDTEEAAALVGAAIPLALLGFPRPLATLGRAGAFAMVGVVIWLAAVDGRGRASAVVGATACLGVMLLDPVLDRVLPSRHEHNVRPWTLFPFLVTGIHVGLVVVESRIAGTQSSLGAAVVITIVAFAISAALLAIVPQFYVEEQTSST